MQSCIKTVHILCFQTPLHTLVFVVVVRAGFVMPVQFISVVENFLTIDARVMGGFGVSGNVMSVGIAFVFAHFSTDGTSVNSSTICVLGYGHKKPSLVMRRSANLA